MKLSAHGMTLPATLAPAPAKMVRVLDRGALAAARPRLETYLSRNGPLVALSRHPAWLRHRNDGQLLRKGAATGAR
jgi:hypothetical protein